ncbi:response regulator [Paenibacillus woosongensis]|uniref:Response regulator n=1 Tax=Paenibacillus woosongensis TaxID=307580 RepID=A0A7X2Z305_9BACL|nr:response regulator [Paenibacillus woosongensis]MUG45926.1 response regulator [Paenibacillus woosongensis]
MRIMIVDDEVIIRTGLAKVIRWQEIGIDLLPPAASAEEALERIPQERPHILLTDIRMSGMSGLELAEEARRINPDIEVIILSGHDDFAYTQQAIRQDVCDYLLKTSRPEEIIKTVLKAKRRVQERWAAESQNYHYKKEEVSRSFGMWVVDGDTQESRGMQPVPLFLPASIDEQQIGGWKKQVLIIAADGWNDSRSESLLLFAVENMLCDLLTCTTIVQKKRIVAAIYLNPRHKDEEAQYRQVIRHIESMMKCTLFVAAGEQVFELEKLHESYLTADEAFGYQMIIDSKMCSYEEIKRRKGGKTVCTYEEEIELSAILLEGDPVALKSWVRRFIKEQRQDPQATLESLSACLHSVAIAAHRWLERVLTAIGREKLLDGTPAPFQWRRDDVMIPQDALFQHLYTIMKIYHTQHAEGQTAHVHKAMAFIEEQLEHDVSLQQVAKHVHLHPNHLSEVFKKSTGMTFGDFVIRKKMSRAMEILAVSPAKVSEVASQVGYEDVKYFSKIFKKYTGKTPSEFRDEPTLELKPQ